jgi:hypothetical protein
VAALLGFNKNTVQRIFQLRGWQVKKWIPAAGSGFTFRGNGTEPTLGDERCTTRQQHARPLLAGCMAISTSVRLNSRECWRYLPRDPRSMTGRKFVSIIEFVGTTAVPKFDHGWVRFLRPDGAGFLPITHIFRKPD